MAISRGGVTISPSSMSIETIFETVFGFYDGVPSREITRSDNASKKASTVCCI